MKRQMTGFTLLELMATLTIAGVLFAIGAPSIRGIFTSNRMATHLNELSTAIAYARNEAIKRATPVAIGTTGGWASDWTVWVDDGATNGVLDNNPAETKMRLGPPVEANFTLAGTQTTLVYQPDGSVLAYAAGALVSPQPNPVATFTLCYTGQQSRVLTISQTGRADLTVGAACP